MPVVQVHRVSVQRPLTGSCRVMLEEGVRGLAFEGWSWLDDEAGGALVLEARTPAERVTQVRICAHRLTTEGHGVAYR